MSDTPTRREFLLTTSMAALVSQHVTGQSTPVQPFRFQRVETNGVTAVAKTIPSSSEGPSGRRR